MTNCETLMLKISDFQKMTNEFHKAADVLYEMQTQSLIKILETRVLANEKLTSEHIQDSSSNTLKRLATQVKAAESAAFSNPKDQTKQAMIANDREDTVSFRTHKPSI
jgi:flagellar capping protein FliD